MPVDRPLGCDFFERRGEKRIDVGTLLTFRIFFFSDGVLCFWSILCVILLSVEVKNHLQVRVCAHRHIDVYTWNPYLHTCNPNLLTSGSLSLSTSIAAATAAATIAVAAAAAAPAPAAAAPAAGSAKAGRASVRGLFRLGSLGPDG